MSSFVGLEHPCRHYVSGNNKLKFREIPSSSIDKKCIEIFDILTKKSFKLEFKKNPNYYKIPNNLVVNSKNIIGLLNYVPVKKRFYINGEFFRKLNQWEVDEYEYNMMTLTFSYTNSLISTKKRKLMLIYIMLFLLLFLHKKMITFLLS